MSSTKDDGNGNIFISGRNSLKSSTKGPRATSNLFYRTKTQKKYRSSSKKGKMYRTHHQFRLEKLKKGPSKKSFRFMSCRGKKKNNMFSKMFTGNNLKKTFSEMKSRLRELEI